MKKLFPSFIALAILMSCQTSENYDAFTAIKRDVEFLASDSLKGREVGTEGEKIAADYVKSAYERIGLKGAGSDGFYQTFFVKDADNPHAQPSSASGENGITGYNVLGMIDNPGDEIIVVGAHFDHLGMGDFSSLYKGERAIHNGADDNASGTAALIHLAKNLSSAGLNKDILFFAISGEEKGLWGSNYFVKNPTVDLSKVGFMINMDMVGRLDETRGLAINGIGTSPSWNELLDKVNLDSIKLVKSESGIGPSDHTSFYFQDIPVLHFFTGQHEDYHKPTDDADKVNVDGIIKVASIIERIIIALDSEVKLAFTKTKDESSSTPRFTVTLGVVPDYLFDGEGMRIDGVSEDKPAMKAGILKGDIVVQLGDSTVNDMMSYMRALSTFKKGDKTQVVINRDGNPMTMEIAF